MRAEPIMRMIWISTSILVSRTHHVAGATNIDDLVTGTPASMAYYMKSEIPNVYNINFDT